MRILYITLENISLHKGSVIHIKEVVEGLKRIGLQVGLVACALDGTHETDCFYNLHLLPPYLMRSLLPRRQPYVFSALFLFLYLFKIISRYDVIYARDYHATVLAKIPCRIFHKRLIYEINGLAHEEQMMKGNSGLNRVLSFLIRRVEERATRYADRIVSVTPQIAEYLVEHFHCQAGKIETISNGVNTEKFYPIENRKLLSSIRAKLQIPLEDKVVVFVGTLTSWQGIDLLIRIAPWVTREVPHLKFLIIGDGISRRSLEKEVRETGLSPYFVFKGMVDYQEIPSLINIADICVLPKRRLKSGYSPVKLYEYMACGKAIVGSRVEGLEFIETEGSGRLTVPEDETSFGEALVELLKDDEKRATMGRKGLQIALERFSWKSKVAKIRKLTEELA
jgi:glycosyltransferase involved in cell wall biosynthesis